MVLPLFWESTKEGALTYVDWRLEVEEYIMKGYSGSKIKDAMFTSLEGKAKRNYQACDEKGDLTPREDFREDGHDLWNLHVIPGPKCQALWPETGAAGVSEGLLQAYGRYQCSLEGIPR